LKTLVLFSSLFYFLPMFSLEEIEIKKDLQTVNTSSGIYIPGEKNNTHAQDELVYEGGNKSEIKSELVIYSIPNENRIKDIPVFCLNPVSDNAGSLEAALHGNSFSKHFKNLICVVSDDEKAKACKEIERKLRNQEIILKAYEDMQILEFAYEYGFNWEAYDIAVFNLAEWIYSGNHYEPGTFSNEQLNSFFTSTPKQPGDVTTFTEMSTDNNGAIWGPNGKQKPDGDPEMVIFVESNGNKNDNYSLVREQYIKRYGDIAGDVLFLSGLAHEEVHSQQAKTEGFSDSPGQQRRFEMAAYKAGMEKMRRALNDLGCNKVEGAVEYNHNVKFNYGSFSQAITVTGSVPFKFESPTPASNENPKVRGSGSVSLTMDWKTEDCIGSGSSSNKVELEGYVIHEGDEKFIDMKFNEQWMQSMQMTVTCDEETKTTNMPVPPPTSYGQMKFRLKDGEKITRPFSGMGGTGTYSWTIRIR
jgi:hypothetical protein